jgi:hypothetical protein
MHEAIDLFPAAGAFFPICSGHFNQTLSFGGYFSDFNLGHSKYFVSNFLMFLQEWKHCVCGRDFNNPFGIERLRDSYAFSGSPKLFIDFYFKRQ